MRSLPASENTG